MRRFLGLDTSCYTTSAAIYDADEGLVAEKRIMLTVRPGRRGLAQSEMVFQHIKNLPVILQGIAPFLVNVKGIGVSAFPRRRADSYMPAFLVGKGVGECLAAGLGVPIALFSHQENHVMAALKDASFLWQRSFYMMHLSGGTHEVVHVGWKNGMMDIRDILRSSDITAGQFIDRVGVAMNLPFPAGKHMERLAEEGRFVYDLSQPRSKEIFSFSGAETAVNKIIQSGVYDAPALARTALSYVRRSLERVLGAYPFAEGEPFMAVGGVMANARLRDTVSAVGRKKGMDVYFAEPRYSSDNASGNAFGAYMETNH